MTLRSFAHLPCSSLGDLPLPKPEEQSDPTTGPFDGPIRVDPITNEPFLPFRVPIFNFQFRDDPGSQKEIVGWKPGYRLTGWRECLEPKVEEKEIGMAQKVRTAEGEEDAKIMVETLNDEAVYKNLLGPPFPYTLEMARSWILARKAASDRIFDWLSLPQTNEEAENEKPSDWGYGGKGLDDGWWSKVSASPWGVIRYSSLPERAGGPFLGTLDIRLSPNSYLSQTAPNPRGPPLLYADPVASDEPPVPFDGEWWRPFFDIEGQYFDENCYAGKGKRERGARNRIWVIGDYLVPKYHSQGIMTSALSVMINQFVIPVMGVTKIRSPVFEGNWASRKTFEKVGFRLLLTAPDPDPKANWNPRKGTLPFGMEHKLGPDGENLGINGFTQWEMGWGNWDTIDAANSSRKMEKDGSMV